jgi:hypothetical protein
MESIGDERKGSRVEPDLKHVTVSAEYHVASDRLQIHTRYLSEKKGH